MKSLASYIRESDGDSFKDSVKVSFKQVTDWRKNTDKNKIMIHYEERDQCYYIYKIDNKDPMQSLVHIGTYNARTGVLYFDKNESNVFKGLI